MTRSLIAIILCMNICTVNAQKVAVETMVYNYLSNGVNIGYVADLGKNWTVEIGPRIIVNTFSLNKNQEYAHFYQNGYAYNFTEHLGLYNKWSKKILSYKKFEFEGFVNFIATRHGLKIRHTYTELPHPIYGNLKENIYKIESGYAFELTLGPRINYTLNEKVTFKLMTGIGLSYHSYPYWGKSLVTGDLYHAILEGNPKWNYGAVGAAGPRGTGIPMIALGLTYSLKK